MGGRRRKPGERFGALALVEYDAKGYWITECDCGAVIRKHLSNLTSGRVSRCGTECSLRPTQSYQRFHNWLREQQGSASEQACADCAEPARDWSYDHEDPDEIPGFTVAGFPVKYSLKAQHYEPRCRPCHIRFDIAHRRAAA